MTQWIRDTTRNRIYARDTPDGQASPACTYCGRAVLLGRLPGDSESALAAATLDHVIPVGEGGTNDPSNLATACWSCNAEKGQRTPERWQEEAYALPRWRPRRPPPAATMAERAALATARPLCRARSGACAEKVERTGDRRTAGAEAAARARRYR